MSGALIASRWLGQRGLGRNGAKNTYSLQPGIPGSHPPADGTLHERPGTSGEGTREFIALGFPGNSRNMDLREHQNQQGASHNPEYQ